MRIIGLITVKRETPAEDFTAWARDEWLPGLGALVSVSDVELLTAHAMAPGAAPASHIAVVDVTDPEEFAIDAASDPAVALAAALTARAEVQWIATERLPTV